MIDFACVLGVFLEGFGIEGEIPQMIAGINTARIAHWNIESVQRVGSKPVCVNLWVG